jgi:putative nucleotidyltransferase with HDIG domain
MGSWEWDAVADVVTWSRELYLTFELNPKLPPPPYDGQLALYAPESAARLDAAVQQALATGQSYQLDLEQSPYNCPGRWVAARGEVKRDDTGAIVGIQGTIQDITERKRAEEELRQSQMLLKSSVESQKDTIFLSVDTSYRYLYFNPAHAAMAKAAYGIDIELGMVCLDVVTNEQDRRTIQADLDRALSGESHTELQVYGWDQPIWFETFFNPVFGPGGEIVGATALSRNVTQRVLSERQLLDANAKLTEMVYATADAIGRIAEARDPYTMGHERRVAELAVLLAQEMNLPAETIAGIEMAGMLHDIGKVAVPSEILTKPGKISSAEFELIKQHPQKGFDIIRSIEFPWPVADSALQHHERMDGTGYPQGLTAEQICLEARVLAVADVVEAMASHRPYRAALGLDVAVEEIESHPQQYDPEVVSALLALYGTGQLEEWRAAGVARRTD